MAFQFKNKYPLIDHQEVYEVLADELVNALEHVVLIDVRESEELDGPLGYIQQVHHIPLAQLNEELPRFNKDETIVFVCAAGSRSIYAALAASREGFLDVASMAGGMQIWNAKGFPTKFNKSGE
ncbi:MAG: rhodanese-like domain-containing protein [Bdellovibrionales bacterium]|nr:rhodanese-like domain-containing protein [Bdellovibrionales bacterium]